MNAIAGEASVDVTGLGEVISASDRFVTAAKRQSRPATAAHVQRNAPADRRDVARHETHVCVPRTNTRHPSQSRDPHAVQLVWAATTG